MAWVINSKKVILGVNYSFKWVKWNDIVLVIFYAVDELNKLGPFCVIPLAQIYRVQSFLLNTLLDMVPCVVCIFV